MIFFSRTRKPYEVPSYFSYVLFLILSYYNKQHSATLKDNHVRNFIDVMGNQWFKVNVYETSRNHMCVS